MLCLFLYGSLTSHLKKILAYTTNTTFRTNEGQLKMAGYVVHVLSGYFHHGAYLLGALANAITSLINTGHFLFILTFICEPHGHDFIMFGVRVFVILKSHFLYFLFFLLAFYLSVSALRR